MFPSCFGNTKEITKRPKVSASSGKDTTPERLKHAIKKIKSVTVKKTKKEHEVAADIVPRDLLENQKTKKIPKLIHFIWLGRLPEKYVNNLSQISSLSLIHI